MSLEAAYAQYAPNVANFVAKSLWDCDLLQPWTWGQRRFRSTRESLYRMIFDTLLGKTVSQWSKLLRIWQILACYFYRLKLLSKRQSSGLLEHDIGECDTRRCVAGNQLIEHIRFDAVRTIHDNLPLIHSRVRRNFPYDLLNGEKNK